MIEREWRSLAGVLAATAALALTPAFAADAGETTAKPGTGKDAGAILERMENAAEPKGKMRADLELTMTNADGESFRWTGDLYWRGKHGDDEGVRRLVLDAPADVEGVEYVIERVDSELDRVTIHLPALERTRVVKTELRGEPFLGTDFNYEDLGYDRLDGQKHSVIGTKQVDGKSCTEVQSVTNEPFGYGRVVRCIDAKTHLPIRTEYYDRADRLWKVRTMEIGDAKGGEALPTRIVMEDVQADTKSTIELTDVRVDDSLPDEAFTILGARALDASDAKETKTKS